MATNNGLSFLRRTGGFGAARSARQRPVSTRRQLQRASIGALNRRQASNLARSRGMGGKGG